MRKTASYQSVNAWSTPVGGQRPFTPSVNGASMLDSMLHKAWWSSRFFFAGARFKGLAFAMKSVEAFNPPIVVT